MQLSEWGEKTMIDNTNDKINNRQSDGFDEYVSSKYDNFGENSTKDSEGAFQDNEGFGKTENDEKNQDESVESFVSEEEIEGENYTSESEVKNYETFDDDVDETRVDEEENLDSESRDEETETFDENQDEEYFDDQNQKSENDKENQVEEYPDDEAENESQCEGVFEKPETDEVDDFGDDIQVENYGENEVVNNNDECQIKEGLSEEEQDLNEFFEDKIQREENCWKIRDKEIFDDDISEEDYEENIVENYEENQFEPNQSIDDEVGKTEIDDYNEVESFDDSQDEVNDTVECTQVDDYDEVETCDESQVEVENDDTVDETQVDDYDEVETCDESQVEVENDDTVEETQVDDYDEVETCDESQVEVNDDIVDEIEIDDVVDDKVRAYSESIREEEEEVVSQSEDETSRQKQEDELSEQEVVSQEDNSVQKEISDSTRNIVMQEEQPIPKELTKQTEQDKQQTQFTEQTAQPTEQEVQPTRQQIQQNQQIKQEVQQLKETSESKAQKYVKEVYRPMDEKRYNVISGKSRDIYDKLIALITDMYDGVYSKNKTFRYKRSEILEDFDVCLQSILLKVALSDDSFSESDARYISEIPCYGKIAKDISFNYFINCSQELRAKLYKIADEKSDKVPYAVMMAGGIDLNGNQGVTKFLVDGMVKIAFNCLYLDNDKVEIQSVKEAFRTIYVFINKQGIKLT